MFWELHSQSNMGKGVEYCEKLNFANDVLSKWQQSKHRWTPDEYSSDQPWKAVTTFEFEHTKFQNPVSHSSKCKLTLLKTNSLTHHLKYSSTSSVFFNYHNIRSAVQVDREWVPKPRWEWRQRLSLPRSSRFLDCNRGKHRHRMWQEEGQCLWYQRSIYSLSSTRREKSHSSMGNWPHLYE